MDFADTACGPDGVWSEFAGMPGAMGKLPKKQSRGASVCAAFGSSVVSAPGYGLRLAMEAAWFLDAGGGRAGCLRSAPFATGDGTGAFAAGFGDWLLCDS